MVKGLYVAELKFTHADIIDYQSKAVILGLSDVYNFTSRLSRALSICKLQ